MAEHLFEGVECGTIRAREERERKTRLAMQQGAECQPLPDGRGSLSVGREQLMARILEETGGRSRDFLEGFTNERLSDYLERLLASREPRGPGARWVRRGETPAIVGREAEW